MTKRNPYGRPKEVNLKKNTPVRAGSEIRYFVSKLPLHVCLIIYKLGCKCRKKLQKVSRKISQNNSRA